MESNLREISGGTFYYFNERPFLKLDSDALELTDEALDTLLNYLKIPRKYLYRFAESDQEQAAANVNHWLSVSENIGGMVDGTSITRIFDSRKLFVPINFIVASLQSYYQAENVFGYYDEDIYVCTVPIKGTDVELCNGDKGFMSIRVMFSECFAITPRVDAVLTVEGCYENYYFPIQGRKFRIVDSTPAQVDALIREFGDTVITQMTKQFVPRLEQMIETEAILPVNAYLGRLCSELRFSKRIGQYLLCEVGDVEMALHDIVRKVGNAVMSEVRPDFISLETAREIEIAISRSIAFGRFK